MKNASRASAPGKIHLIGEHSAVYGKPAILASINKRVYVTLSRSRNPKNLLGKKTSASFEKIQEYLHQRYKIPVNTLSIDIHSEIPVGRGLGSSAALSAALSCALHDLYTLPFELDSIFDAAYEGERYFHGNPSGGDLASCVIGGVIWFRKETELVKITKKLDITRNLHLFAIDTGKPVESTKEMVTKVGLMNKKRVTDFCNEQEFVAKMLADALIKQDVGTVNKLIGLGGENLVRLGIVGSRAGEVLNKLKQNGILAKVSGGGGLKNGSGMIVGLLPKDTQFEVLCRANKLDMLKLKIETSGVRIESYE